MPEQFREVMAAVATPVAVVTTLTGDQPHGTTVSAFTSLSMNPPMVLVSLARTSNLLHRIRDNRRFGVNVLGAGHAGLATAFARKEAALRFRDVSWSVAHGVPRLGGVPGWLACRTTDLLDGGDHVIVLGEVLAAESADSAPLVYFRRTFGTHQATGAVAV
ncbi:flavin reductase [Actinoplanes capillaceus]|uniref:Flavin reductase n=1 Tax=Actinoplanes campanulatus TaxID=113559 RepID=A0ABQ3WQZ5_9ACTN|nr:flavin reductase family protein [Actinoplanes capillaceus]GID48617.1 flavin reductase [Actinoplanes capillaceus]